MRRIAIFCLLGPPLGWTVLWLALDPRFIPLGLFALPWLPLFGFAPALVTAQVDDYLVGRLGRLARAGATALAGAAVTGLWVAVLIGFVYPFKRLAIYFAIGGAIASAICSWLSSEKKTEGSA
ncbi:MAG TPA: hypothetical protein VFB68_12370 [Xanthobacteraceae bacterium]|nr:hypothetical protein [Xanthobacteraceae bacterium]